MRRKKKYFDLEDGGLNPVIVNVKRRISFSEVDAMAIAWHGRYPQFFECAAEVLMKKIGLSYENYFKNNVRAPIVKLHVDYFKPLILDEEITVEARLHWTDAARLNTEYSIIKEDGSFAAAGYTVQMFTDANTGLPFLTDPAFYIHIRENWRKGVFHNG